MANPLDDLPQGLADLIRRFGDLVDGATERLQELGISFENVTQWQEAMEELIMRYHIAGFMRGADSETVSKAAKDKILEFVNIQFGYLDNFALEIVDSEEWVNGWNSRAKSYALAIKVPYWTGKTKMLPLPSMPAEGTDCLTQCKCKWDIKQLSPDVYSAKWVRHSSDSCTTCVQRASEWSDLRVIDGVLQL